MVSSNQETSYRIGGLMEEINKVSSHKNNAHQPQPKKQIRRRLQTSKPYQERLMNMAEARREIVTALKFHRASMKQQQQQQQQTPATATNHHGLLQETSNSGNHPATSTAGYNWSMPPIVPPPPPPQNQENMSLVLPNQTLGLNLNFKHFNNLNTSIYYNPSSSSASPAGKEVAPVVSYERRCKTSDEMGAQDDVGKKAVDSFGDDDDHRHPFEQVTEFPPWLINANENSSLQELFDHHFCNEYSPDPALPCMDIGEIEGIDDGDWLA